VGTARTMPPHSFSLGFKKIMRTTQEILAEISSFHPTNDEWVRLDSLLSELWGAGDPTLGINTLLEVFSKYPEEDGSGVFWSIVHGLESLNGYEPSLLKATIETPSLFGVIMLGRLLNAGEIEIEGRSISNALKSISNSPDVSLAVQNQASKFLERHK
jgi:hypothetical protein